MLTSKDGLIKQRIYIFNLDQCLSELQNDNYKIVIASLGVVRCGLSKAWHVLF
jgi:hypothetical protein